VAESLPDHLRLKLQAAVNLPVDAPRRTEMPQLGSRLVPIMMEDPCWPPGFRIVMSQFTMQWIERDAAQSHGKNLREAEAQCGVTAISDPAWQRREFVSLEYTEISRLNETQNRVSLGLVLMFQDAI
jgi:hypothetical protein